MKKSLAFLVVFFFFLTLVEKSDSEECSSHLAPKGNCRRPKHCAPLRYLTIFQSLGDLNRGNAGSSCTEDGKGNLEICCPIIPVACTSPSVQTGTCETLEDCPELTTLQNKFPFSEFHRGYGGCPPDGEGTARWCCPSPTENCTSPLVQKGTCETLEGCPELKRFQTKHSFSEFNHAYGGCPPDNDGTNRWCCPITEDCTHSWTQTGQCRLVEDCPAVQPLINVLSQQQLIDSYGSCGRDTSGGGVRICCP